MTDVEASHQAEIGRAEAWLTRVADRLGLTPGDDPWDEVERRLDETLASLTAERDRLRAELDGEPDPCPLDHGCDPDGVCSCWCHLHDCALGECPTFKIVESWLANMRAQHEKIVAKLTAERDIEKAWHANWADPMAERDAALAALAEERKQTARMRAVVEAARAWAGPVRLVRELGESISKPFVLLAAVNVLGPETCPLCGGIGNYHSWVDGEDYKCKTCNGSGTADDALDAGAATGGEGGTDG